MTGRTSSQKRSEFNLPSKKTSGARVCDCGEDVNNWRELAGCYGRYGLVGWPPTPVFGVQVPVERDAELVREQDDDRRLVEALGKHHPPTSLLGVCVRLVATWSCWQARAVSELGRPRVRHGHALLGLELAHSQTRRKLQTVTCEPKVVDDFGDIALAQAEVASSRVGRSCQKARTPLALELVGPVSGGPLRHLDLSSQHPRRTALLEVRERLPPLQHHGRLHGMQDLAAPNASCVCLAKTSKVRTGFAATSVNVVNNTA